MWNFPPVGLWDVGSNPKHDEFFVDDARGVAQSLIREISQNSGDAPREGVEQVTVRFKLGEIDRCLFRDRYMKGLIPHLQASDPRAGHILAGNEPVRFLAIEDFGTTGLIGGFESDDDEESGFIRFWKRYGDSGKEGKAGGRHGVGKSTLSAASRLRFFFGVTVREDGKRLLYGQAALRLHRLAEHQPLRQPYGLFSPASPTEWPRPFEGEDALQFASDFNLKRGSAPGLSLVVPFPVSGVTHDSLVSAAIEHCFHQILSDRLRIEIGDTLLERETILDAATEAKPDLVGALDLSLEAVTMAPAAFVRPLPGKPVGNLQPGDFSPEDLDRLRQRWIDGDPIAVEIPIRVRPKTAPDETGNVRLFLKRALSGNLARETYVRGRLSVPETPKIGSKMCVGLLVADEGPASKLLGDSENPAHTHWVADRVRGLYHDANTVIRAIKHALRDLHVIVAQIQEQTAIKDALKDFFWTPKVAAPSEEEEEVQLPKPKVEINIEPTNKPFEVTQVVGGFTIRRPAKNQLKAGDARVWVAYNVRRGKPKWNQADFRLDEDNIDIDITGEGVVERYPDHFVVRDAQPGFAAKVTGFVPTRDLRVNVEGISSQAAGE